MSKYDIDDARKAKAARAHALESLEKGEVKPAEILREPPVALKKTDIWDILLACHGLGREEVRVILERASIWPHTQLGLLTKRERLDIIKELPERVR